MAEDKPSFFSQPLPEETKPKKRIVHRRVTKTNTTTRRKSAVGPKISKSVDTQKINRQLNEIYRDENGKIPDMSNIKIEKSGSTIKSFFTFIIAVGLLAAAAWAGFFMMPQKNFTETQVNISIEGPENVIFGATTTYEVIISNQQKIDIKNVNLTLRYPESFVFATSSIISANQGNNEWNLENIEGNKNKKIQISGFYYGPLKEDQSWRASVRYQPENFNSELQRSTVKTVRISSSPFSLYLTGPDKVAVGAEVEYIITLEDREGKPEQKFIIQNEWPNNFYITTSSPALEKNNDWKFTYSPSTSSTSTPVLPIKNTFKVIGKFSDSEQKDITVKSSLLFLDENKNNYKIGETKINTELTKNSVSLQMAINGSTDKISARPGEILNTMLSIKNESADKLTKATVNIYFDAPAYKKTSVIDWANIADKLDGDVVGKQISDTIRQAKITWTTSKLKTLNDWKAGQEIQFDFQVPIKDTKIIDWSEVKESLITATPEITFTNTKGQTQTITGKPLNITINSDLSLEIREEIEKDGIKEEHNITWVLTNSVHNLKNILLTADLYGDITVTEPISVPAGKVTYDAKEKRLSWEIPQMNTATDILALPFTVTINKKNPTQNLLVSKVRLQAEDTVTEQKIDLMGKEIPLKAE